MGVLHGFYASDCIYHWRKTLNATNGLPIEQCNGCCANISYFDCPSSNGLFVRKQQIEKLLVVNYSVPRITIDDRVYLSQYECNGVVKYVGKPEIGKPIVYGIQILKRQSAESELVFVDSMQLRTDNPESMISSRCNLFIHGYLKHFAHQNIASDIVNLIRLYANNVRIHLTDIAVADNETSIIKKYQAFDLNDDVIGPSIIAKYNGLKTHHTDFQTLIAGNYQFSKSTAIDSGDCNIRFFKKTTYEITKYDDGDSRRIFRLMKGDNEAPIMKDYKSMRTRLRHDIHFDDVSMDECDHAIVWNDICDLYGMSKAEVMQQFDEYGITLHGLC